MLRLGLSAVHRVLRAPNLLRQGQNELRSIFSQQRNIGTLTNPRILPISHYNSFPQNLLLSQSSSILSKLTASPLIQPQVRTLTKFSLKKGKRKSVKAVVKRFKRLHWGAWIRTRCGRHKKMWKKSVALKRRLRQHVFVNGQQSMLLDKMVTGFWRRPKYYIDDPYTPYHTRNEFKLTKGKPW